MEQEKKRREEKKEESRGKTAALRANRAIKRSMDRWMINQERDAIESLDGRRP